MKKLVSFFEIPTADFGRAVKFYETVLNLELSVMECESDEDGLAPGAISWAADFLPAKNGVLVHLNVDDMDATLALIKANGGSIVREKTKIESEDRGYFAMFSDSEGNTLGLYSAKSVLSWRT